MFGLFIVLQYVTIQRPVTYENMRIVMMAKMASELKSGSLALILRTGIRIQPLLFTLQIDFLCVSDCTRANKPSLGHGWMVELNSICASVHLSKCSFTKPDKTKVIQS